MKLRKAGTVCLASLMIMTSTIPALASTGWNTNEIGKWYEESDGNYVKNTWKLIHNKWYYFNNDGYAVTGWQDINGPFLFDSDGALHTDWAQKEDGNWYYFTSNGARATGWNYINGKWYYMNEAGVRQTGWQLINGAWYHLSGDGAMNTGWFTDSDGSRYYLQESGAMVTGPQEIGNKEYLFLDNGRELSGNKSKMEDIYASQLISSVIKPAVTWGGMTWDMLRDVGEEFYDIYEDDVNNAFHRLNEFRNTQGSERVYLDKDLCKAAFAHAASMISFDYFGVDTDKTPLIYDYAHAGVIFGFDEDSSEGGVDAAAVCRANTVEECINSLNNATDISVVCHKDMTRCGIGMVRHPDGRIYMTILLMNDKGGDD